MPKHAAVVDSLAWLLADEEETLAHGLHDDVHPSLAAIRMSLEAARHGADASVTLATVDASLSALEGWARAQQGRVRASLLKRVSLAEALLWYGVRLEEERGAAVRVFDEAVALHHSFAASLALLGYTQEQLHHHVRSSANQVSIRVWANADHCGVSTNVTMTEGSAPELRFARLVRAMGGTSSERYDMPSNLTIAVSIPRI